MECNKEEALRAKMLAENKMRNGDFVGAKKIAQKAQQLFPEIENIFQLLCVCDVHCSAQIKVNGNETDWYGILQVERTADESVIRKQYRKLALLLHPDKNKFSGAEAAFKLIGEANMVLSNRDKRHVFDMKMKMVVRNTTSKAPPHHSNRNTTARKNNVVQGATSSHFTERVNNQPQVSSNPKETFWTCCPFCNVRFQYYKDFLNRALRCQSCVRPFIAYDLGDQGVPVIWNHTSFNQQNAVPDPGNCGSKVKNNSSHLQSGPEVPGNVDRKVVGEGPFSRKGSGTAKVEADGVYMGKDCETVDMSEKVEKVHLPRADKPIPQNSRAPKKNKPKKGRKQVVESSESSLNNKSSEIDDKPDHDSGIDSGKHPRRSSRQKRNISYSENFSDDDFGSHPKKKNKASHIVDAKGKEDSSQTNIPRTKRDLSPTVAESIENLTVNREASAETETVDNEDSENNVSDDELDHDSKCFVVPDAEFNDFDKAKENDCFAVGQIWAVYDTNDGMPRFYVLVRKVFFPEFKLRITWLESRPDYQDEIKWCNEDLPICCGQFGQGKSEFYSDKGVFSHLVNFNAGNTRNTYMIHPKKGETWALFKDWNLRWSSHPENHRKFGFEVVRIVSDYSEKFGAKVVYLEKVEGFVSLFRSVTEGIILFVIPPKHKLRFSHQIPSFVTDGTEGRGVEAGCFELDPAALPLEWFEPRHLDNIGADNTGRGVGSRTNSNKDCEHGSNSLSRNTNMDKNTSDLQVEQKLGSEDSKKSRHCSRSETGGMLDKQSGTHVEGFEKKFTINRELESDMKTENNTEAVKHPTKVKGSDDLKIPIKGHGVNVSSEQNSADVSVEGGTQFRNSQFKQAFSNTEECDEVHVVNDGES